MAHVSANPAPERLRDSSGREMASRVGVARPAQDSHFGVDLLDLPLFALIEEDTAVASLTAQAVHDSLPLRGVIMPRSFEGSAMSPEWRF